MAAYVSIPRDLSQVKTKVLFNLTKRQLICFGTAALIGVPSFFILKSHGNTSLATMSMIFIMMPFFLLAMYEKNGMPLEVILMNFIRMRFLRPRKRPYRTDNYYAVLIRQNEIYEEVERLVLSEEETGRPSEAAGTKTVKCTHKEKQK